MNEQTITVTFNQQQVTVQSNATAVLTNLCQRFGSMCRIMGEQPVINTIPHLTAFHIDNKYHLHTGKKKQVAHTLPDALQQLENEIAVAFIRQYQHLLWFHAGVATWQNQATLFVGEWGRGKSTLVTQLVAHGWTYFSDEFAPVNLQTDDVYPFPQLPQVRKPVQRVLPRQQIRGLEKQAIEIPDHQIGKMAVPVQHIIFPMYTPDEPTCLESVSPAMAILTLLNNCLNVMRHKTTAVAQLTQLLYQVPVYQLSYHSGLEAAQLIVQQTSQTH